MRVTGLTRMAMAVRRQHKTLTAPGYELIEENGHPLWELARGGRTDCRIIDAVVAADGQSVFVKIVKGSK